MPENKIEFMPKNTEIGGIMRDYAQFVAENQLKNREEWKRYAEVFRTHADDDGRWRGEYFGKQMRGGATIYEITRDEELYDVLTEAVEDVLSARDELGRISSYSIANEFRGWDMWCRKYVLVGLEYFYRICRDEALKAHILEAEKSHADYILSKIGAGKKSIVETSDWWGCVNSCTILEPIVELYKLTGEKRYIDFAAYIISTGGSSDCDFVKLDLDDEIYPYRYPVVKAYETMSYHEGLLAYYEATGDEVCFEAAKKFFDKVLRAEVSIIGCAGCTNELFDNAAVRQTEPSDDVMQETCVTVTLMRTMARLYTITGDQKYVDRIENSGFNALYGSLNLKSQKLYSVFDKKVLPPRVFDSYSPLFNDRRGRWVGGYCEFENGDFSGCCIAIGACGIGLMPLSAIVRRGNDVIVNFFADARAEIDCNGKKVLLTVKSDYPASTDGEITVSCDGECDLPLYVRKPAWADKVLVDGAETFAGDLIAIGGKIRGGRTIRVEFPIEPKIHELNDKIAITFGPLVLAADERKQKIDFTKPLGLKTPLAFEFLEPEAGELARIAFETENDDKIILTDYQSCGKFWNEKDNRISVWLYK